MHAISTNVCTSFNSLVATYLMGCEKANEQMTHRIYDLCWVDEGMLIVADNRGGQLVKYNVNMRAKTCEGQLIESVHYVTSVSCSEGGKLFVSASTGTNVKILIYDVKTGQKHHWNTELHRNKMIVHISESRDFIVLSVGNQSYIFNNDRVPLYKFTFDVDFSYFRQTYVTKTGIFFGITYTTSVLLKLNLLTKESTICNKGNVQALGVSGTENEYVYVTYFENDEVGVYSPDGTFLNYLQIETPQRGGKLGHIGALKMSDDEDLIAFSTWIDTVPIAIYKVTNQDIFEL